MKIAVYTYITNNYDTLKSYDPEYQKEADFFIFTDDFENDLIKGGYYNPLSIDFKGINDRYTARYYKINSHLFFKEYDYVIYIDGTTKLNISPTQLIEKYLTDADLAAFKYPDEDCTYIHAEKCKNVGRFLPWPIDSHMMYYKGKEFPEHFGFSEVRVVLRKNTKKIEKFNELWWHVYHRFLTCDQLCFDYCVWKLKIKRNWMPFNYPDDPGEHEFPTLQSHNYHSPHRYE